MKNAFLFALSVGGLSVAQPSLAATLYDSSPATLADLGNSYQNNSTEYNLLARFTLSAESQVNGFSILTSAFLPAVGDSIVFKLLDSGNLYSLNGQIENLSSFDGSDEYFWASTSFDAVTLAAGTYWIGMSGLNYSLDWASTLAPGNSNLALVMFGDNFADDNQDNQPDIAELNMAFRVSGDVLTPPIPEPSTWIMMIAGFGLAGATLRRRTVTFQAA